MPGLKKKEEKKKNENKRGPKKNPEKTLRSAHPNSLTQQGSEDDKQSSSHFEFFFEGLGGERFLFRFFFIYKIFVRMRCAF
jgi:hypothetical protein